MRSHSGRESGKCIWRMRRRQILEEVSWGQCGKSGNRNNLPREHAEVRNHSANGHATWLMSRHKWFRSRSCLGTWLLTGYSVRSQLTRSMNTTSFFHVSQNWLNSPTVTNTKLNKHIWPDQVLHAGRTQTTKWQFKYRSSTLIFYFIVLNLIWAKTDVAITIIYRL